MLRRSYQYRAKISEETERNAKTWLFLCCILYNTALEQRKTVYKQRKKTLTYYDQSRYLTELKQDDKRFYIVSAATLQDTLERLDRSYKLFFSNLKKGSGAGEPKFKAVRYYNSFTLKRSGWKLHGNILTIKNVGDFHLVISRPIPEDIRTINVQVDRCGDWFVTFSCLVEPKEYPEPKIPNAAIHKGIIDYLTLADGTTFDKPNFTRGLAEKLKRQQQVIAEKKKGSNNYYRAVRAAAKTHRRIARRRKDFLHKITTYLVQNYGALAITPYDISNMFEYTEGNKVISDAAWHMFDQMLTYKAEEAGRPLVTLKSHDIVQLCSNCNNLAPKNKEDRMHDCPHCKISMPRNENAAKNIAKRAGFVTEEGSPRVIAKEEVLHG